MSNAQHVPHSVNSSRDKLSDHRPANGRKLTGSAQVWRARLAKVPMVMVPV